MIVSLVIACVGPDRAGLVSAISDTIAAHGGTWLESRLARLAGQFAGVVRADAPEANAEALKPIVKFLENDMPCTCGEHGLLSDRDYLEKANELLMLVRKMS